MNILPEIHIITSFNFKSNREEERADVEHQLVDTWNL
jgi:hypothetical protein